MIPSQIDLYKKERPEDTHLQQFKENKTKMDFQFPKLF